MIDDLRRGDVLDGDAHGLIKRHFAGAASSRPRAGEDFADLGVNDALAHGLFFEREGNARRFESYVSGLGLIRNSEPGTRNRASAL